MTPNEAELIDVESHYPTDRIPMEMKEKSVAENLLDKMSETQSVHFFSQKSLHFLQIQVVFLCSIVMDAVGRALLSYHPD